MDFLFLMLFFLTPIMMLILIRVSRVKIMYFSIPSIFIVFFLVNAYVGILPLYYYWDEYRFVMGVTDKDIILKMQLFSSISVVFVLLGVIFSVHVLRMQKSKDYYVDKINKHSFLKLVIFGLLSIIVLFLYMRAVQDLPILSVLMKLDFVDLLKVRSRSGNAFQGNYHWYYLFMRHVLLFTSYIAFASYLVDRRLRNKIIFIILLLASMFSTVMQLEKAPLLYYLLGIVITFYTVKKKRVNIKLISKFALLSMSLLSIMYMFFMNLKGRGIRVILTSIFSRLFTGSITPAYFYLKVFPSDVDFLLGRSFPNPRGIFPWEHYRLTVEMMNKMTPELASIGVVGSAPTVFWAEAYANFGIFGLIIFSFIVGIVLQTAQNMTIRSKNITPVFVGLNTWLTLELYNLTTGGVSLLFGVYIPIVILIALIMQYRFRFS